MSSCRYQVIFCATFLWALLAAGCHHATDGSTPAGSGETEQAGQPNALFRMPIDERSRFLHIGLDQHQNWSLFVRDEPLSTALRRDAAETRDAEHRAKESAGKVTTSKQKQNGDIFGGLLGEKGGPRYDATAVFGVQFTASAPGGHRFSAAAPGSDRASGSGPPIETASGSEFSASVADSAGQTCTMRPLCSFIHAICEFRPSALNSDAALVKCGSIGNCYRLTDELTHYVNARSSKRRLCQAGELFQCAARRVERAGSTVEFDRIPDAYELDYLLLPTFNHCFRQQGVDPFNPFNEQSSSTPGSQPSGANRGG